MSPTSPTVGQETGVIVSENENRFELVPAAQPSIAVEDGEGKGLFMTLDR